ncbi:MAG: hypothetical protein IJ190_04260 [Prevotella sp.]|nr:hypothetical protein [Prevotella sp.]
MQKDCSIVFSLVALTLSIVALFGIHQNTVCIPDLVLTLLGVCAALIVGVSVVNTIELLEVTRQLKEIDKIRKEVDEAKARMEELRQNANFALHVSYGLAFRNWQPINAITECLKALDIAMQQDDCVRANTCVNVLGAVLEEISKDDKLKSQLKGKKADDIPKDIPKWYKDHDPYKVLKDKIGKVFEKIKSVCGAEK